MALIGRASQGRVSGLHEVANSAETLFENRTVVEIREVEARTQRDIDNKMQQLRKLVGDSYRELISGADILLEMVHNCEAVRSNISKLQGGFDGLSHPKLPTAEQDAARLADRQLLYALGARVKYLVDTPEVVWGCLDASEWLEAAHRLLRAQQVLRTLTAYDSSLAVTQRFPLLKQLGPSLSSFLEQATVRATERLAAGPPFPPHAELASALAALAYVQGLSAAQALQELLDARQRFLDAALSSREAGATSPASTLGLVAAEVQDCLLAVGCLLLRPPDGRGRDSPSLLSRCAADEGLSSSELLFGDLPPLAEPCRDEAAAWQALSLERQEHLGPLTQEAAAPACQAWVGRVAEAVAQAAKGLLQGCQSVAQLKALERDQRAAIQAWSSGVSAAGGPEGAVSLATPRSPLTPPSLFTEEGEPPKGNSGALSWTDVAQWVLGKEDLDVWAEVFEAAFLQRGKDLLAASVREAVAAAEGALPGLLQAAAAGATELPGSFKGSWPEGIPSARSPLSPQSDRPIGKAEAGDRGWRQQAPGVHAALSEGLHAAAEGARLLLSLEHGGGDRKGAASAPTAQPSDGAVPDKGRARALQPFLHAAAVEAVQRLTAVLSGRLDGLSQPGPGRDGLPAIEQALCLGRLAALLSGPEAPFEAALGPSSSVWRGARPLGPTPGRFGALRPALSSRSRAAEASPSAELRTELQGLRQLSLRASGVWATWAASALSTQLAGALESDPVLTSVLALRQWEETVVPSGGDAGGPEGEVRFRLPAAPSSPALLLLLGAGREVARAGGPGLAPPAVARFARALASAVPEALRPLSNPGSALGKSVMEKGALQLLFDVFTVQAALGCESAEQHGHGPKGAESAFSRLEAALQDRLDPIDWATYEPFLREGVARFVARSALLFGTLTGSAREGPARTPDAGPAKASAAASQPGFGGEGNLLALAPTAARLRYLPITSPPLPEGPQASSASLARAEMAGDAGDVDASFSFADLGPAVSTTRPAEGRSEPAAQSSALEVLQNELSSQVVQRLGDFSFATALGQGAGRATTLFKPLTAVQWLSSKPA